jgi:hypothetical protein
VAADAALAVAHAVWLGQAWQGEDRDGLLELSTSSVHFLTNTIAIVDIFVHLITFSRDEECNFEPAKSTNAFLFSAVGTYSDLAGVAYSRPRSRGRSLAWALLGESAASAVVSLACYVWGRGTVRACETRPLR